MVSVQGKSVLLRVMSGETWNRFLVTSEEPYIVHIDVKKERVKRKVTVFYGSSSILDAHILVRAESTQCT